MQARHRGGDHELVWPTVGRVAAKIVVPTTMRRPPPACMIVATMQPTTRIVLDVSPGPPIHGHVCFGPATLTDPPSGVGHGAGVEPGPGRLPDGHDSGDVREFSGWIGLLAVLQAAVSGQADT